MNNHMHSILERTVGPLKKDDQEAGRVDGSIHYTFDDIISKLPIVNAGRTVCSRGKEEPIHINMLLNPYSPMMPSMTTEEYRLSKNHTKTIGENNPKKIRKSTSSTVAEFVQREFESFADILHGLTKENLYRVIYEHKKCKIKKLEDRIIDAGNYLKDDRVEKFSEVVGRLYPLARGSYDEFSRKLFRKYKSPTFKKRFMNGVVFGSKHIDHYEVKVRNFPRKMIGVDKRYIGLVAIKRMERMKLGFDTDSGVFTCIERNNTKKQNLWELVRSRKVLFSTQKQALATLYYGHGRRKYLRNNPDYSHLGTYIFTNDTGIGEPLERWVF